MKFQCNLIGLDMNLSMGRPLPRVWLFIAIITYPGKADVLFLGSGHNLRVGVGWLVFENCVH